MSAWAYPGYQIAVNQQAGAPGRRLGHDWQVFFGRSAIVTSPQKKQTASFVLLVLGMLSAGVVMAVFMPPACWQFLNLFFLLQMVVTLLASAARSARTAVSRRELARAGSDGTGNPAFTMRRLFRSPQIWTLSGNTLVRGQDRLSLENVTAVRLYSRPGPRLMVLGADHSFFRHCRIDFASRGNVHLSHGPSPAYEQFIHDLVARIETAAPAAPILAGLGSGVRWVWMIWGIGVSLSFVVLAMLLTFGLSIDHTWSIDTEIALLILIVIALCAARFAVALRHAGLHPLRWAEPS